MKKQKELDKLMNGLTPKVKNVIIKVVGIERVRPFDIKKQIRGIIEEEVQRHET